VVLRNLAEIHDPVELEREEAQDTTARLIQLRFHPIAGVFDAGHLRAIHRHLFQSMYSWAAEFRTVAIAKGGSPFCQPAFIESSLARLLTPLNSERQQWAGIGLRPFAGRAAWYLNELNAIHPFREGNGRTQREFIRELAVTAGFDIRWSALSREEMIQASQAGFRSGVPGEFSSLLERALQPVRA
jgi:cell filamentation protein